MNKFASVNYKALFRALRPTQWVKNLAVFAAIILNGQLLDPELLSKTILGFLVFCALSSGAYLINDVVDVTKDRLHPVKKNRPIATGEVSKSLAVNTALFLILGGICLSTFINFGFFAISTVFVVLQFLYSFVLKKKAVFDIVGIATFFIIRAYAGELATGYHLPVWIMLSVIFLALFIASGKRRSELLGSGSKTRSSLKTYSKSLLNFYTTMFGVSTLITYAMFTFNEELISFSNSSRIHQFLIENFPKLVDRKWYMVTIFPVVFGIMRYGQVIFEMQEGERPEKVITTDIPLLLSLLAWGLMMISIIYVL